MRRRSQSAAATPLPGAPPSAAPDVLVGRYARATATGLTMELFDWSVEVTYEYADVTAHGDRFRVRTPLTGDWTARARGYFKRTGAAETTAINEMFADNGDPVEVTFSGYRDVTSGTTPTPALLFSGTGFVSRATFAAPMALVEQEVEIVGNLGTGPATAFDSTP